jgi:hypothetical protein
MNQSMEDNKTKHGWDKLMSHDMDENWQHYKMVIDYIQSHMTHVDDSH